MPQTLSFLTDVEYESVLWREGSGGLVFNVGRLAEALVLVLLLWPPSLLLLGVDREALARHSGGTWVLMFDLADVAKALAQFEHSSEMLALILVASQEATEQFGKAMEVEEAFLGHWPRLHLDFLAFAFAYAGVATEVEHG